MLGRTLAQIAPQITRLEIQNRSGAEEVRVIDGNATIFVIRRLERLRHIARTDLGKIGPRDPAINAVLVADLLIDADVDLVVVLPVIQRVNKVGCPGE